MATYIHIPEKSGIYQIVNNITQRRYIGYASSIRQRLKGHVSDLSNNKHANDYLQKSWNKYGAVNFTLSVLQECSKDQLCLLEDYWVKVLKTTNREFGYNLKDTNPNGNPSCAEETKAKLRISNKNVRPSELCIQKKKEYWFNNPMTEDHKTACREGLKKVDWITLRKSKRKKVINIITGEIYDSLTEVCNLIHMKKGKLSKYLLGTRTNKTNFKYL